MSENTSRIAGVPKASRNSIESRTVVELGKAAMGGFLREAQVSRCAASNHEKSMGGVALELVDQAVFPIEVGLHRAGVDVGALVGTPVAVGRIGFWQNDR